MFYADINECASNACQNGATCIDLVNGYTCTCVIGYTGINCQTSTFSYLSIEMNSPTHETYK